MIPFFFNLLYCGSHSGLVQDCGAGDGGRPAPGQWALQDCPTRPGETLSADGPSLSGLGEEHRGETLFAPEEDHLLLLGSPALEGPAGDGGAGWTPAGPVQPLTGGVCGAAAGSPGGGSQRWGAQSQEEVGFDLRFCEINWFYILNEQNYIIQLQSRNRIKIQRFYYHIHNSYRIVVGNEKLSTRLLQ